MPLCAILLQKLLSYFAPFILAVNFKISLLKSIKSPLGRYLLIQVIKANITSNGTNQHCVQRDEHTITSVILLPKMQVSNIITKKHETNPD